MPLLATGVTITVSKELEKSFDDIDALLHFCEERISTTSCETIEAIIYDLEQSIEVSVQMIPVPNTTRDAMNEIARNL